MDWSERLARVLKGMATRGGAASDPDEVLREAARDKAGAPPPEQPRSKPGGGLRPEVQRAYANLELTPPSSLEEAKSAWRRLMGQFHPDRFQDPAKAEKATLVAARLTEAYRIVKEQLEATS